MLKQFPLLTLLLCSLVLGFSSCEDDDVPNSPYIGTIADNIADDPQFSMLAAALDRTGLDAYLDVSTRRLTLFAPTDAAFQASGVDVGSLSDEELADILRYHVITGTIVDAEDIADGDSEVNSTNQTGPGPNALPLLFNNSGGTITINDNATVTSSESGLVNGTIHTIDQLLVPPTVVDRATLDGRFSILLSALERVDLDDVLADAGSYTIFAPTDDAFTASGINLSTLSDENLTRILSYHVVSTGIAAGDIPGGVSYQRTLSMDGVDSVNYSLLLNSAGDSVVINGESDVIGTDLFASNGVVHAIDMVLSPQNVVDFVVKSPMLDSLQQALMAAGLVDDLMGAGPFTVFAPTNAAFTAASDTIATLSEEQLLSVLQYHVALGRTSAGDLEDDMMINGINGQSYTVVINQDDDENDLPPVLITPDSMQVNFITTDIQATNGVIHLIDGVLLPKLD